MDPPTLLKKQEFTQSTKSIPPSELQIIASLFQTLPSTPKNLTFGTFLNPTPKKNEKITYRLQAPMFFQRALSFWVSQSPGHGFVHWTSGLSSLSRVRYIPPKDLDPCPCPNHQKLSKKLNSQIYFRTWVCSHHSDSFSIIQPFRTFFSLSSWIFAGPFGCHSVGAHLPWVFPQVPQLPQTLNSWVNRSPVNDIKKGSSWSRIDYISPKNGK